jgi:hypothetical protein
MLVKSGNAFEPLEIFAPYNATGTPDSEGTDLIGAHVAECHGRQNVSHAQRDACRTKYLITA